MKKLLGAILSALALSISAPATAVPVGLELVLLVDVSGSVDATEYGLQKTGYVQAFQNAAVQAAILASQGGAIAVTYVEWSSDGQQSQQVGWTLIDDAGDANSFAAAIAATVRAFNNNTGVQDAIRYGADLFAANGFEGLRQVIDVSGDGTCNSGNCSVAHGRDYATGIGVDTINGLAIGGIGIANYYNSDVKAGGGFVVQVDDFADFGTAIRGKLIREISNVPEPGTLTLLGLALAGLGLMRRRSAR